MNLIESKHKRCKWKVNFISRGQRLSSASAIFYGCVVPAGNVYFDCHSSNDIYLINSMHNFSETVKKQIDK